VLTCQLMRSAVVLSATLLALGTLTWVLALALGFGVWGAHLALLGVLTATAVILMTFILALLPERISHLEGCRR
jgi:hypothetical protein